MKSEPTKDRCGGRRPGEVLVVDPPEYGPVAAVRIAWALQDAADESERVSLALAGGSTPRPVYEELARLPTLPWERVDVYFGDEREVPPDHPDSNYGMAREALLDRLRVRPGGVHRMEGDGGDREAAARTYGRRLPDRLDLMLLGIGADGHTASLFPGSPALEEERRKVVRVTAPIEAEPRARMTVTPPVIRGASRIVVLARGEAKARAVARALSGSVAPSDCPAVLAREGTWILDPGAASALEGGEARSVREEEGGPTPGREEAPEGEEP